MQPTSKGGVHAAVIVSHATPPPEREREDLVTLVEAPGGFLLYVLDSQARNFGLGEKLRNMCISVPIFLPFQSKNPENFGGEP